MPPIEALLKMCTRLLEHGFEFLALDVDVLVPTLILCTFQGDGVGGRVCRPAHQPPQGPHRPGRWGECAFGSSRPSLVRNYQLDISRCRCRRAVPVSSYWVSQRYRCSDTSTAGTWRAGRGRTKVERVRKRSLLPEDDMYKHVVTTAVSLSMCDTSTAYRASSMRYWYRRNAPAFRLRAHPRTHPPDVVGRPCQALGSKAPGPLEP